MCLTNFETASVSHCGIERAHSHNQTLQIRKIQKTNQSEMTKQDSKYENGYNKDSSGIEVDAFRKCQLFLRLQHTTMVLN